MDLTHPLQHMLFYLTLENLTITINSSHKPSEQLHHETPSSCSVVLVADG